MGKQPRWFRERRLSIGLALLAAVLTLIALPSVAAPLSSGSPGPSSGFATTAHQTIGG